MIKETWELILQNQEIRQNLSRLRQELKEHGGKEKLSACIEGDEDKLISLLKHEDAKTRKNAALLLGDLGEQRYLEPVYRAYEEENQMFVKSSYLAAIRNFDYRECMVSFKARLDELSNLEVTTENQKHITEELRELSALVVSMDGVKLHTFQGMEESYDVILLTNRNFQEITMRELKRLEPHAKAKVFGAGVMASVGNLNWMDSIRTHHELLFVIRGMQTCPMEAYEAAKIIVNSELLAFMTKGHLGKPPYHFRVEYKSRLELDKRSDFTKKLSAQIERLSARKFINTTSNYEFEIRLIESRGTPPPSGQRQSQVRSLPQDRQGKEGGCNMLVKLYTLKDDRFSYRKEVMPTSIKAVNAALTAELAKGYMKEDAQVLDPFCGVGTMLIERHKAIKANTMYGLDIQEEAILKARSNTEAAKQIVHYVNRDFFDFKHEYLFDEIITDMPFRIGRKTKDEIYELYVKFFQTAGSFLKEDGLMVLYSHDEDYVKQLAPHNGFCIVKTYEISMKEGTYVFVLNRS